MDWKLIDESLFKLWTEIDAGYNPLGSHQTFQHTFYAIWKARRDSIVCLAWHYNYLQLWISITFQEGYNALKANSNNSHYNQRQWPKTEFRD